MLTQLRFQNFKSWRDTGSVRLAPLTGLFGPNSSGKTSLLQFLLLQKQTVESLDLSRVLHTGDERTYVNLGTFQDLIYKHQLPGTISFETSWTLPHPLPFPDLEEDQSDQPAIERLSFRVAMTGTEDDIWVDQFVYQSGSFQIGMERLGPTKEKLPDAYGLIARGSELNLNSAKQGLFFGSPRKNYIFHAGVSIVYPNSGFLADLALRLEEQTSSINYVLKPRA